MKERCRGTLWAAVCLVLAPISSASLRAQDPRVLMVSIDGLRSDVITAGLTPTLHELKAKGLYTLEADAALPPFTIPNHVSMLTGLDPETHGFRMISDPGDAIVDDTILELARDAGLTTGLYLAKDKLRLLAKADTYDRLVMTQDGISDTVVDELVRDLASPQSQWRLTFVHITEPDVVGHAERWMSEPYLEAVRTADAHVGRILEALDSAGLSESTFVIVTSDHGGENYSHANRVSTVLKVPWIASGPAVPSGEVRHRSVSANDHAPTILNLLGLELPDAMDGSSLADLFRGRLPAFRPGDSNVDSDINLSDAVYTLDHLFRGGPNLCAAAADTNGDLQVSLSDPIYLLYHLFQDGPSPPAPYPDCGEMRLGTALSCEKTCL